MKVKISPFFWIFAVIMFLFGNGGEFIVYFIMVVFHEMAHAEVARRYGYALSTINLMPYGASLTGSFESLRPSDEIKIALAGPMANIIIAIVCVALWWLAPISYFFTLPIVYCNISLALFNLLPIFPLDGGRVLLAFLSQKYPRQMIYRKLKIVGIVVGIIFSLLFIASIFVVINPTFAIIALFVIISTIIPDKTNTYQRVYAMAFASERLKRGLPVREIMVDESRSVLDLTKLLNVNNFTIFLITDTNFHIKKRICENELEDFASIYGFSKKICELI